MLDAFETTSARMLSMLLVTVQAPAEDVDRIMQEVARITPLDMGKYDCNAFQTATGVERYRPLEGAAAGAERDLRKRPDVLQVSFELQDDQDLLQQVIEVVFQAHSYEEPVYASNRC